MLDFRPPKDNRALLWLVKLYLPAYMKVVLHDTRVMPVEGALQRFHKADGMRAMICPNHSNRHDPQVMFALSRYAGEDFNFVAAREVFDWDHGMNGWWLQHLGCYSVVRGASDRESFKTSKRILVERKKKLVLFPEGEISRQNDTLMPLESGAAQLALWAVDELVKGSKAGGSEVEPVVIVPVAIKYTFPEDIRGALRRALARLEDRLNIGNTNDKSLAGRLRAVSKASLGALEMEYLGKSDEESGLDDRISRLRSTVLDNVAHALRVQIPMNQRHLDTVRLLRNTMDDIIYADEHEHAMSEYQRKIHQERAGLIKRYYKDLDRVVNFVAIHGEYVVENRTQERFSDVLDRLETEVLLLKEPSFRGRRLVLLDVGEPINVSAYHARYKKDKRNTINEITEIIGDRISSMLSKLDQYRKPVLVD